MTSNVCFLSLLLSLLKIIPFSGFIFVQSCIAATGGILLIVRQAMPWSAIQGIWGRGMNSWRADGPIHGEIRKWRRFIEAAACSKNRASWSTNKSINSAMVFMVYSLKPRPYLVRTFNSGSCAFYILWSWCTTSVIDWLINITFKSEIIFWIHVWKFIIDKRRTRRRWCWWDETRSEFDCNKPDTFGV